MRHDGIQTTFIVRNGDAETTYYSNHYDADPTMALDLIQQEVHVTPAVPQILRVEVPGANGAEDLTEVLGVGVKYSDRTITWTFALYPGADFEVARSRVSNRLNGKRARIIFDTDPDWEYSGRIRVADYSSDRLLQQITVEALVYPYKHRHAKSGQIGSKRQNVDLVLTVNTGEEWQVPEITTTASTTMVHNGVSYALEPGVAYQNPDWYSRGQFACRFKGPNAATINIRWMEGSL